jgi:membrane protein
MGARGHTGASEGDEHVSQAGDDSRMSFRALVVASVGGWYRSKAGRLAAALAYYALLSLAPTAYIIVFVVGVLYGADPALAALSARIEALFGEQAAELLQGIVASVEPANGNTLSTLMGIAVLIWGGSGFFLHLRDALNTIWNVIPPVGRGALHTALSRLASFSMVLLIGVLLFVAILVNTALSALASELAPVLPFSMIAMRVVQFGAFFVVFVLLLAMMYKLGPDARIAWGDVWVGAAVTAVLLLIGQAVLGIYLGRSRFTTIYGAAGILIVVLVWVFYTAQILFLGAHFTREYANRYGSRIRPHLRARRADEPETDAVP